MLRILHLLLALMLMRLYCCLIACTEWLVIDGMNNIFACTYTVCVTNLDCIVNITMLHNSPMSLQVPQQYFAI